MFSSTSQGLKKRTERVLRGFTLVSKELESIAATAGEHAAECRAKAAVLKHEADLLDEQRVENLALSQRINSFIKG